MPHMSLESTQRPISLPFVAATVAAYANIVSCACAAFRAHICRAVRMLRRSRHFIAPALDRRREMFILRAAHPAARSIPARQAQAVRQQPRLRGWT